MSELLDAMLRYRPRTIPLHGKVPAVGVGWPQWEATPDSIRAWLGEHGDRPDANVGIRTGDGLVVLDIDPRHGGDLTLRRLERDHGRLPDTPEVATGGGGRHLYFLGPRNLRSATLGHQGATGIEIKANGCQVAAPPSIHPGTRREYVWTRPLVEADIVAMPAWLLALAEPDRHVATASAADLAARDPLHRVPSIVYVPRLTGRPINRHGYVTCPFHGAGRERTPSLRVYPTGGWKYYSCSVGGRIYQLAGLLGGYRLPLTGAARRAVRAELIAEFHEELAG